MPVIWDATAVEGWEDIDPALKTSVDFMAMAVGIGEITEANAREFWRRTNIVERLSGAFRTQWDEESGKNSDFYLTPEEAKSLVGYRVNVSSMSKQKFNGHALSLHDRLVACYKWPEGS